LTCVVRGLNWPEVAMGLGYSVDSGLTCPHGNPIRLGGNRQRANRKGMAKSVPYNAIESSLA